MLVFDLPSFPYVFKVIKDFYPPPKDTTREQVKRKYLLKRQHDRVGRMADTLEYSNVAFPRHRFDDALVAELAPLLPEPARGGRRHARHPATLHRAPDDSAQHLLPAGGDARAERHVRRSSTATRSRTSSRANIFLGDMLWKNFGVTRHVRRSSSTTTTRSRYVDRSPLPPRARGAHRRGGDVGRGLVPGQPARRLFRRRSALFLLGDPAQSATSSSRDHADLLDAVVLARPQAGDCIRAGHVHDVVSLRAARSASRRGAPRRHNVPSA